jgi:hypothetical protein
MNYINLTPHAIRLNDGRCFEPSGTIARVSSKHTAIMDDVCGVVYGEVSGLPEPVNGTRYIVSTMVLAAINDRGDVVAPATGHPDVIRNDKGQIVSVPCFRL